MAMTPARLVVNGCSYMKYYSNGNGHLDLAKLLNINHSVNLAQNGSCNSRIIRTTLRDSFNTTDPTLYIIGTTFLTRYELPLASGRSELDGKWISFSGSSTSMTSNTWDSHFTNRDLKLFADAYDKATTLGLIDLAENLMWQLMSMIESLKSRGHRVIIFNTAEHTIQYYLDDPIFNFYRQCIEIVGGWHWCSISWQFEQGAEFPIEDEIYPANCRHVAPGQHKWLNHYLTNYIQEHKILA